jgi:hypothetical protein
MIILLARREPGSRSTGKLGYAEWVAQSQDALNLSAGPGVAVREFTLESRPVAVICSSSLLSQVKPRAG